MKTIKSISRRLLILTAGLLVSFPGIARDFSFAYEGKILKYTVIDENAKTCMTKAKVDSETPGNKVSGDLIIPSTVSVEGTEYTVVGIGEGSFDYNTRLTSVTIPNTVTEIGREAFSLCENLYKVNIGNSVINIGSNAFASCGFEVITIPASVKTLGSRALYGCENLNWIYINGVIENLDYPVTDCWSLKGVIFPSNEIAAENEKFFKQFRVYNNRDMNFFVGDKRYTPQSAENNRTEAKMPYSITKDRGQLYWIKGVNGKRQLVDKAGKVILTDTYDKIYFDTPAIIVSKNGKWGAVSYTGKVLAQPIYNDYQGHGVSDRLWFSNNTSTGYKYFIISQNGVILGSRVFTRNQYNSSTAWLKKQLNFISKADWSFPAK